MRLKNDVNLVDFLNQVQKCKYVVLVEQKDVWDHSRITCEEADREILADYLEMP